MHPLDKIFRPNAIACIGASNRQGSIGHAVFENLHKGGFKGKLFAVNPGHRNVREQESYSSVRDIPEKVDLAVIATPSHAVLQVLKECGKANVGGVLIISSATEAEHKYSEEIQKIARKYNLRIIGPDSFGIVTPSQMLNASLGRRMAKPGKIAFISQSGALCSAILDWSVAQSVGFSHFVALGEAEEVSYHDLIDYFGGNANTACILIYMESLIKARKFMSAARAFSRTKPIIVLRAGQSGEGARAARSHTGSIVGHDAAFGAAFRRAGIIRVERIAQLFHVAQALAMQPRPTGNRLAIVTNAGGPAVLATDFLVKNGGALSQLSEKTMAELHHFLPKNWSHGNPVDVLGDAPVTRFAEALDTVLRDPGVDGVLTICVVQAGTDELLMAEAVASINKKHRKTLFACWMGEADVAAGRAVLEAANVPDYRYPESAVDAFLKMYQYQRNLDLLYETPPATPRQFSPKKEKAEAIIMKAIDSGKPVLSEPQAKEMLSCYDIPIPQSKVAKTVEAAVEFAKQIRFPVALKIVSPDIGHKLDVGGVLLGIKSARGVEKAFAELMDNVRRQMPAAKIEGILVEKMVAKKHELLIGARFDPTFGPVIAFGLGGTAVEVFRDVSFGLPPLTMALAQRIIERTKVSRLLRGYRGQPAVDLADLQFLLVKFSYLLMDFPEIKEIDINPYVMDESGGMVLDAHIVLQKRPKNKRSFTNDHLVVSPYPEELEKEITLKNGHAALLRPIRPEDGPEEEELFRQLSPQSVYFRFFGHLPKLSERMLRRFTHIDYDRELAIVVEVEKQGEKVLAGVVRLVNDYRNRTAEYAIVVGDPWQGLGLGNILTDYILDIARERGLKKVTADTLADNEGMMHIFRKRGFEITERDAGVLSLELKLGDDANS